MIVGPDYVYISTPKSGTHTMYHILASFHGGKRMPGPYHRRDVPEADASKPRFTVVRNPYSRMVAAWWSMTRIDRYRPVYLPLIEAEDFKSFALWRCRTPYQSLRGENVSMPQAWWHQNTAVQDSLHLETIDADIQSMPWWRRRSEDYEMPNLLHRLPGDWREHMTDEIASWIYLFCKADFDQYEYGKRWQDDPAEVASAT